LIDTSFDALLRYEGLEGKNPISFVILREIIWTNDGMTRLPLCLIIIYVNIFDIVDRVRQIEE